MRYPHKIAIIFLAALLIWSSSPLCGPASAEETPGSQDEVKQLLQKGLTIHEIDQEIARLNEKDAQLADQIHQNEADIDKQSASVQETRKHAGKVLRAYYAGDRDSIWMLMLSVNSLSDAIRMFEYIQMIIANDHKALTAFTESYDKLKQLRSQLEASHNDLQATKDKWLQQRQRVVQLQEELDKELAMSAQASVIQEQIKTLNDQWQEQGLPLFRQYLNQLSAAFVDFPQYIMQNNTNNKYLDLSSFNNPLITITDQDFNEYLHAKNDQLKELAFEFKDDSIIATGKKDNLAFDLQGKFTLIEGTGMNEVQFIINRIDFNGFELPDTTIEDITKQFKLGFVPKKLVSYLDVVGVETKDGKAVVKLKISF